MSLCDPSTCAPDCAERDACDRAGNLGHAFCGHCSICDLPVHACAHRSGTADGGEGSL